MQPDDYPIIVDVPVAWGDMSVSSHVNNTALFHWIPSAVRAALDGPGVSGP